MYSKGDSCHSFDIVLDGVLASYSLSTKDNENIMFYFTPNTFMGGNLLFANKPIYPMSIYAQEDSIIFCLNKEEI
ncbi:MAG: cyclic nucleotide-binding domain-containing protein [Spirochaetaceae bacterium]|nr:cyclic nucleotide-binding domain-containing protein [Spirochaetaceae bacterium]